MLIGFATTAYNTAGNYMLNANVDDSDIWAFSRRTNKTKLLDGTVSVVDYGYSAGDRDFVVVITDATGALMEILRDLIKTYSEFTLSLPDGIFTVNADAFSLTNGGIKITLIGK